MSTKEAYTYQNLFKYNQKCKHINLKAPLPNYQLRSFIVTNIYILYLCPFLESGPCGWDQVNSHVRKSKDVPLNCIFSLKVLITPTAIWKKMFSAIRLKENLLSPVQSHQVLKCDLYTFLSLCRLFSVNREESDQTARTRRLIWVVNVHRIPTTPLSRDAVHLSYPTTIKLIVLSHRISRIFEVATLDYITNNLLYVLS